MKKEREGEQTKQQQHTHIYRTEYMPEHTKNSRRRQSRRRRRRREKKSLWHINQTFNLGWKCLAKLLTKRRKKNI